MKKTSDKEEGRSLLIPITQDGLPRNRLLLVLAAMMLSLAAVFSAAAATAATNALTPYLPRWGSPYQSRTAGRVTTFDAARTNAYDAAVATRSGQARAALVPVEAGPNHRSWRPQAEPAPSGSPGRGGSMRVAENSRVVELGSGMHYWDGQQWAPSDASFDLTEDAFVANRVQHRTRLNADLNVIGAVTTTLRDGTTLRSTPVAIALYDPNDGRFAVVSVITNTPGVLLANNRVVFADAFRGEVCADVVYTIQQGSFEQDVVITVRFNPRAMPKHTKAETAAFMPARLALAPYTGLPKPVRSGSRQRAGAHTT